MGLLDDGDGATDAASDTDAAAAAGDATVGPDAANADAGTEGEVEAGSDAEAQDGDVDAEMDASDADADMDAQSDASDAEAPDASDGGDRCTGVVCAASDQCHAAGTCDPASGTCTNPRLADGTTCNDGNACTQMDACLIGVCMGMSATTCRALDQCHGAGTCNPATGACSNPPLTDNTGCNDGNACTQTDTCQGGACTGSNPVQCTAVDQCHAVGVCNAGTGQCSNPDQNDGTACNDGKACTSSDVCTGGTCGGTSYTCNPGVCQVTSTCDGRGGCAVVAATVGTSCPDDGNPCTTDICDGASTCTHPNVSKGTSCGAGLVCGSGNCVSDCFIGGALIPSGTANATNTCQVCTPTSNTTDWTNVGDGTACNDGDPNTAPDTCTGGVCSGLALPTVVITSPQDGAMPIAGTTLSVTFSTAMDPTTLTAQTSAGTCSGSVQLARDDGSCISFASAQPVMSAGSTVATFTAAPGLLVNRTYKMLVAASARSAAGVAMAADYSMTTGFKTVTPTAPVVQNESGSTLEASYCDMQFPTSYSGNVNDTVTMYGQIYEVYNGNQITGTGTPSAMITAQFGYAPANANGSVLSNPEYQAAWTWADASYNAQHYIDTHDSNDEYLYTVTLPPTGHYTYTYRFSLDGGASWTYCDVGGAGTSGGLRPFDFGLLSTLQVN